MHEERERASALLGETGEGQGLDTRRKAWEGKQAHTSETQEEALARGYADGDVGYLDCLDEEGQEDLTDHPRRAEGVDEHVVELDQLLERATHQLQVLLHKHRTTKGHEDMTQEGRDSKPQPSSGYFSDILSGPA